MAMAMSSHEVVGTNCRTSTVQPGDSCGSLATRCSISPQSFTQFNPDPHLCSTLQPGQLVCCSSGSLPDLRPKPNPNGACATYIVQDQDTCSKIAATHGLIAQAIEQMNSQTWGWSGCQHLQVKQILCLSSGSPPMPPPIDDAICGPQKPGTHPPSNMAQLAQLNPCPLNVCCSKWGQCGTTADFCVQTKSPTGAPGTNGCLSNCGMEIVNNQSPPPAFRRVGYFEAWNSGRPCLNMNASQIDATQYDYVHFAFAQVTSDFKVDISHVQDQFDSFTKQSGFRKIVSFGGWSFSTSQDSYAIFRSGVSDANRVTFAQNVVDFVQRNNLDGVDFDWEYPGATDMPGIPPGSPDDGIHYVGFLQTLRGRLTSTKSISIAAPASYWYLKGFPIADIGHIVDYIVYMTYDLHGQWDYGNKWAAEGCPNGGCLRSHVNYTETLNALAMITKAGVSAAKVLVGIASYGRSFRMSVPGCAGPMCTFTGPDSGATPGLCTKTPGYLANAEINNIIAQDPTAKTHYDQSSDSTVLEFGGNQWVAFLDASARNSRVSSFRAKNLGGTVEWAIDLDKFYGPIPKVMTPAPLAPHQNSDSSQVVFAPAPFGIKKGLAYNNGGLTNILSRPGSATWAYNWGTQMNAPKFQQIPMYWGPGKLGDANGVFNQINAGHAPWVLGYNEPDETHENGGCQTSPQDAHSSWGADMFRFHDRGVRLVCPAVSSWITDHGHTGGPAGLTWLRQFASIGNDPSQLRCDAQALHWYGVSGKTGTEQAQLFIDYVAYAHGQVNDIFHREMDLWITEFSPIPINNAQIMADFLKVAIPWLDKQPWVARYAPFMADYLVSNNDLNAAGQAFVNMS